MVRYPNRGDGNTRGRAVTSADSGVVVAAARGWLGTPYHDQASVKGVGCDCLGLARGVWREVVGAEPAAAALFAATGARSGRARHFAEGCAARHDRDRPTRTLTPAR